MIIKEGYVIWAHFCDFFTSFFRPFGPSGRWKRLKSIIQASRSNRNFLDWRVQDMSIPDTKPWGRSPNLPPLLVGKKSTPPQSRAFPNAAVWKAVGRWCCEKPSLHGKQPKWESPSFCPHFRVVVLDELKHMITQIQHFEVIKWSWFAQQF